MNQKLLCCVDIVEVVLLVCLVCVLCKELEPSSQPHFSLNVGRAGDASVMTLTGAGDRGTVYFVYSVSVSFARIDGDCHDEYCGTLSLMSKLSSFGEPLSCIFISKSSSIRRS